MNYFVEDIITLYRACTLLHGESEEELKKLEIFLKSIGESGDIISAKGLEQFSSKMGATFPYLKYVTLELLINKEQEPQVKLSPLDIKVYSALAYHYDENRKLFK